MFAINSKRKITIKNSFKILQFFYKSVLNLLDLIKISNNFKYKAY